MSRVNPLLVEAWRGLGAAGPAQAAGLNYLVIQALVLFVWWPKDELVHILAAEAPPATLLAMVVAHGLALAYYNLRAGAEELLLPGQQSLRDWAFGTPLGAPRVLSGYLQGQLLQSLYSMLLAAPLLAIAFAVGGVGWQALTWCLAAALAQALCYRLLGAILTLALSGHATVAFFAGRAGLVLGYGASAALFPAASHLMLSAHLLKDTELFMPPGDWPPALVFLLVHALLAAGLAATLLRILSALVRARDRGDAPA